SQLNQDFLKAILERLAHRIEFVLKPLLSVHLIPAHSVSTEIMLTDKLTLVNQQLDPSTMGHRDRRKGLAFTKMAAQGLAPFPNGACPCLSSRTGYVSTLKSWRRKREAGVLKR